MITPNQNETYEQWAERSRQYELAQAHKEILTGEDPVKVLEKMAYRLIEKMLYPLYNFLKEEQELTYNSQLSKSQYDEYFIIKGLKPKPDHIVVDK
jgi:glutamyl-tRNA reductase